MEQHLPFVLRSEEINLDGSNAYICYLVDKDGFPYGKESVVPNHWMQRMPSSLMNSLQSQQDVEWFQMHIIEELHVQDGCNHDHINVKEKCYDCFYQPPFLSSMNNVIFCLLVHQVESFDDIVSNKVILKISLRESFSSVFVN